MTPALRATLPKALQSHDLEERLDALQALKNDVVGHVEKKEKWLENGVLDPIVKSLNISSRSTTNRRRSSSLSTEEDVRLQALQLLSSFARGGFAFLAPLHSAGAISGILSSITPHENPPQITIAALRAILNIAEATLLAPRSSSSDLAGLAVLVFVSPLLKYFQDILSGRVTSRFVQTQRDLVAKLISVLCTTDPFQRKLTDSGVLDALATNLASVVVARGFALPGAEAVAQHDGVSDLFPDPAAPGTDVTAILEALTAIIGDSKWRACALAHAPAMLVVFPNVGPSHRPTAMKACASAFIASGLGSRASRSFGVMDTFLPVVPEVQHVGLTTLPFPPRGASQSRDAPSIVWNTSSFNWDSAQYDIDTATQNEVEESESPLLPWLIHLARSSSGIERFMAASLATSLFKAGYVDQTRESYMGRLILPILIADLENELKTFVHDEPYSDDAEIASRRAIIERGLALLAKLIVDSSFLQKCSLEYAAVPLISGFLKEAYKAVSKKPMRTWSPTPQPEKGLRESLPSTSSLGSPGQLPLLAHLIRVREAALTAVAALAGLDAARKMFVEQEVVPYIVESLSATPSKPTKDGPKSPKIKLGRDDGSELDPAYGANPVSVIIAACNALRALSRDSGILRTALQDSGLVNPAFRLLRHPNMEVQIAASGLMANLVTVLSPMRNQLDIVGVMRVLCGQTRSQNPTLRLNALWCLKHWVSGASLQAKKDCLEELTPGWLTQLINEDKEDDALYQRASKNEKQATNDMDEDVDMTQSGELSKTSISALLQDSSTSHDPPGRTARLQRAAEKITEARENELNQVRKVRDDDLAIQEQGLNFLRNLLGHVDSVTDSAKDHAEMIEHLFSVLDKDKFFQTLHEKLRPKVLHPFARRHSSNGQQESRVLYPQPRIIVAVVYILTHMAASIPKYRQILMAQDRLLADLSRHFSSKDNEVRASICNLLANLTSHDNEDETQSRERAGELKKLGLLGKLETLEHDDPDLNVRERAKAAIWQIQKPRGY